MAQPSRAEPSSTFIVRLRAEWSGNGPRWHGRIDHVQSGEQTSFGTVKAMLAFIHSMSGWRGDVGTAEDDA